jgi:hypothetical protein
MREGMEEGYSSSPMAALKAEFEIETVHNMSIEAAATILATKLTLNPEDIEDRGVSRLSNEPRFSLTRDVFIEVDGVTTELQELLKKAAELIKECETFFHIDPRGVLVNLLRGAQDLGQIFAAWNTLRKRIALGLQYFEKYNTQYQTQELPTSPASTDPGIIDSMVFCETDNDRLCYMYQNIPHHQEELNDMAKLYLPDFRNWESLILPPSKLVEAYPLRPLEEDPSIITYNEIGECLVRSQLLSEKAKESVSVENEKHRQGWGMSIEDDLDSDSATAFDVNTGVYGPQTPYKTSSQWFVPSDKPIPNSQVLPVSGEPNILEGLGSPQPAAFKPNPYKKTDTDPHLRSALGNWRTRNLLFFPKTDEPLATNKMGTFNFSPFAETVDEQQAEETKAQGSEYDNRGSGGTYGDPSKANRPGRYSSIIGGHPIGSGCYGGGKGSQNTPEPSGQPSGLHGNHGNGDGGDGNDSPRNGGHGNGGHGNGSGGNGSGGNGGGGNGGGGDPGNWGWYHNRQQGLPGPPGPPGPPGGGGGGPPNMQGNKPNAAYGTMIPTIKAELKIEQLPVWDGNYDSAVEYFWKIQQLASLGGISRKPLGIGYGKA